MTRTTRIFHGIYAAALAVAMSAVALPAAADGGAARTRSGKSGSGSGKVVHRLPSRSRVGIGFGVHYGSRYFLPRYSFYGRYHPFYPWGPWGAVYYPGGAAGEAFGAFDLNVKPKKTEVYLDGQYVGTAGKLDGYPSYLWVERGDHELVFYRPGYETVVRQVTALPRAVIDIDLQLVPGESTPPEELFAPAPAAEIQARQQARQPVSEGQAPRTDRPAPMDLRGEPGRFQVEIEPADASVYLDGRFLGSGAELARLHSGLIVDPGSHQLEVVRPGFGSRTLDFEVDEGEEIRLEVRLERL